MKYQQLDNLESGWKWQYLVKKHRDGVEISRYLDGGVAVEAAHALLKSEHHPTKVAQWIALHMNPALEKRLKQTIRARRKRHFNAKQPITKKKSIDLEFVVWQRLAEHAQTLQLTLSGAITHLLEETAGKAKYTSQLLAVKQDLASWLGNGR